MPGRSAVRSSLLARKSRHVPPAASNIAANAVQTPAPAPATVPAITNVVLSEEERAAEIDRLQDWSMNDDAESLNHIVADLTSPEKEIREAALEATKQFVCV